MRSTSSTDVSVEALAHVHRWLDMVTTDYPTIPPSLLELFGASEGLPSAAALQQLLGCTEAHAEAWRRVLEAALVSPEQYRPLFAAEDAMAARRMQWQSFDEDVRATNGRLQDLNREVETTLAYAHLGESQAVEVKATLEELDQERVTLLRHQGDLPGTGALIEEALALAKAALSDAQETLQGVRRTTLQAVEERWVQEGLTLLPPLVALLGHSRYLDQAWSKLGEQMPNHEHGSRWLREHLLQALRA